MFKVFFKKDSLLRFCSLSLTVHHSCCMLPSGGKERSKRKRRRRRQEVWKRSMTLCVCSRYERQQNILKAELDKAAEREREAAKEEMIKAMTRERQHTLQEAEKVKQLVRTLVIHKPSACGIIVQHVINQCITEELNINNSKYFLTLPAVLVLVFFKLVKYYNLNMRTTVEGGWSSSVVVCFPKQTARCHCTESVESSKKICSKQSCRSLNDSFTLRWTVKWTNHFSKWFSTQHNWFWGELCVNMLQTLETNHMEALLWRDPISDHLRVPTKILKNSMMTYHHISVQNNVRTCWSGSYSELRLSFTALHPASLSSFYPLLYLSTLLLTIIYLCLISSLFPPCSPPPYHLHMSFTFSIPIPITLSLSLSFALR